MVLVEAVIRPQRLEAVKSALSEVGARGLTVTDVSGYGKERGHTGFYRGVEYTAALLPKVKVEVIVPDNEAAYIAGIIAGAARTGEVGDGRIFLIPVSEARSIRTDEEGAMALL